MYGEAAILEKNEACSNLSQGGWQISDKSYMKADFGWTQGRISQQVELLKNKMDLLLYSIH